MGSSPEAALALAAASEPIPRVMFAVSSAMRRERIAAGIPAWAARAGVDGRTARRLFVVAGLEEAVESLVT